MNRCRQEVTLGLRLPLAGLPKRCKGFSLVELMSGLVLLAILSSTGLPMYRSFIIDQRLRATSSDLRIALVAARSEAVKRNRGVTLSPNTDGWSDGWSIADPNDADAPALYNHKQSGQISITGPASVQFTPSGRVRGAAPSFQIDVGETDAALACMQVGLEGQATYTEGLCL